MRPPGFTAAEVRRPEAEIAKPHGVGAGVDAALVLDVGAGEALVDDGGDADRPAGASALSTCGPGPRSSDWTVLVPLRATAVPPLKTRKTAIVAITLA